MPRAQRRTWIKLFCYERLHGSVAFQLEPDERSVWDELLCLAGLCGLDGLIADRDSRPFPHSFIAHELHIPEELLERTLTKCQEEGRITENEHGLYLTNWKTYQSEYERQKPYRQKSLDPDAITSQPKPPLSGDRVFKTTGNTLKKEGWQIERDIKRDALTWFDSSHNDRDRFAQLKAIWPMKKQKQAATYIRTHPEEFKNK